MGRVAAGLTDPTAGSFTQRRQDHDHQQHGGQQYHRVGGLSRELQVAGLHLDHLADRGDLLPAPACCKDMPRPGDPTGAPNQAYPP